MKNSMGHQELDSAQPSAESKIIELKTAKELGLKRYRTGKSCKYGHFDERLTSSRGCITCIRERARKESSSRSDYFKSYYKTDEYKERKKLLVKKPENRRQMNKRAREHYQENKELFRKRAVEKYYKMTNEQTKSMRETRKNKRNNCKYHKAIESMRNMLFRCLRLTGTRKKTKTESLLCYTKNELVDNLQGKFTADMSWDNYGSLWEIDHIMPVSYCVKIGIKDPAIINQLDNLNPLLASENREKSNKVPVGLSIKGIKTYWGKNE